MSCLSPTPSPHPQATKGYAPISNKDCSTQIPEIQSVTVVTQIDHLVELPSEPLTLELPNLPYDLSSPLTTSSPCPSCETSCTSCKPWLSGNLGSTCLGLNQSASRQYFLSPSCHQQIQTSMSIPWTLICLCQTFTQLPSGLMPQRVCTVTRQWIEDLL